MRWKAPQRYDERITRRFLFLPRCIYHEWRWLEFAIIRQEYVHLGDLTYDWVDMEWVNE